jgi:8-oxo-dGTP diphosphatase
MEVWDVRDINGVKTGKTVERGSRLGAGEFHLVVDVWVRNLNGRYLISKRSPNKPRPNMWETTGGSAIAGEESLDAAIREVKEEVGVELTAASGKRIRREVFSNPFSSYFLDTWVFEESILDVEPICQVEEVSEAKWAEKAEILRLIRENAFVSHLDDLLSDLE